MKKCWMGGHSENSQVRVEKVDFSFFYVELVEDYLKNINSNS